MRDLISETSGWLPFWAWLLILGGIIVVAMFEYAFRTAKRRVPARAMDTAKHASENSAPAPDWRLHELFLHIDPNAFEIDRKGRIGQLVKDRLSTGQLKSWGRQIVGSRRLALAPIPGEFWTDSIFTYCPPEGDAPSIWDARAIDGRNYGDVQVNRGEALALWPIANTVTNNVTGVTPSTSSALLNILQCHSL
jgi:hypothetical protein